MPKEAIRARLRAKARQNIGEEPKLPGPTIGAIVRMGGPTGILPGPVVVAMGAPSCRRAPTVLRVRMEVEDHPMTTLQSIVTAEHGSTRTRLRGQEDAAFSAATNFPQPLSKSARLG